MIVFTMPSLDADDHDDRSATSAEGSAPDAATARAATSVAEADSTVDAQPKADDGPHTDVAPAGAQPVPTAVEPGSPFAPPTPDMRAEYIYSLVEAERERIEAAREMHAGLIERLRRRRK